MVSPALPVGRTVARWVVGSVDVVRVQSDDQVAVGAVEELAMRGCVRIESVVYFFHLCGRVALIAIALCYNGGAHIDRWPGASLDGGSANFSVVWYGCSHWASRPCLPFGPWRHAGKTLPSSGVGPLWASRVDRLFVDLGRSRVLCPPELGVVVGGRRHIEESR